MANPNLPIVNPLSLWGTILAGAQQGLDSQSMYAAINTQLEASGQRYGQTSLGQVASLWGQAKALATATHNLAEAPSTYSITGTMIGVVPYGQTAQGRYGAPRYDVRVNFTVGSRFGTEPRSAIIAGIDPATYTVGQLRAEAYQLALDSAGGSPIGGQMPQFVSLDSISIEQS